MSAVDDSHIWPSLVYCPVDEAPTVPVTADAMWEFTMQENPVALAEPGKTVLVAVYRFVGMTEITCPVRVKGVEGGYSEYTA